MGCDRIATNNNRPPPTSGPPPPSPPPHLLLPQGLVDCDRIVTNNPAAMLRVLGVEAARATIVREVMAVFGAYGIGVDPRHLSLIADHMTHLVGGGVVLGCGVPGWGGRVQNGRGAGGDLLALECTLFLALRRGACCIAPACHCLHHTGLHHMRRCQGGYRCLMIIIPGTAVFTGPSPSPPGRLPRLQPPRHRGLRFPLPQDLL